MDTRTILDGAGRACRSAGNWSRRAVEAVRLRSRLAALRAEADDRLLTAGRMVYATHTGAPTPSEKLLAELRAVDVLRREIADTERRLRLLEVRTPPGNGGKND